MAFVHVEGGRRDAERAQQAHAADAQQHFLHDPRGAVAAINAVGQVAEMLLVLRQIRVQQIERHAPDIHAPDLEVHHVQADFHGADEPFAIRIQHRLQRHVVRIHRIVVFRLPVVGVNGLLKIALPVKQADADKSQAEIAGGLGMVAGQDAEAAGGNRQRFVQAKLRREIRDGVLEQLGRILMAPGVLVRQVGLKLAKHAADAIREARFLEMNPQLIFRDLAQDGHGVVPEVLPAAWREPLEQVLRLLVPTPPEVARQLVEAGNELIQFGARQRFLHKITCYFALFALDSHPARAGN